MADEVPHDLANTKLPDQDLLDLMEKYVDPAIRALDTAMRPDEIFKLIWRDVNLESDVILVRAENTKIETERIIGITPRLKAELLDLWNASPNDPKRRVFGVSSVKSSFRTACREADVKEFRFRDCRHTATTRMVNSGLPQAEIMKMTGHTQLKTFLRYVNPTHDSARTNAETFGSFVGAQLQSRKSSSNIIQSETIA